MKKDKWSVMVSVSSARRSVTAIFNLLELRPFRGERASRDLAQSKVELNIE